MRLRAASPRESNGGLVCGKLVGPYHGLTAKQLHRIIVSEAYVSDPEFPRTRYALSGDVHVAFQTMNEGSVDIVIVPGLFSHVEFMHELPGYSDCLRRLATYARVITFDKRGQGLSDKMSGAASLEMRMDDVRAVMEATGSQRAVIMGFSEGCALSALFAATYPDRVAKLILVGGFKRSADRIAPEALDDRIAHVLKLWGSGSTIKTVVPSLSANRFATEQFGKFERLAASPGTIRAYLYLNYHIDISSILPTVRVPTLVLHRTDDLQVPVELGQGLAASIPEAKYIEYPGADHAFWSGDPEPLLGDIEEFVTGHREIPTGSVERVLATVLFTDIVDSTRRAAELGDRKWRQLLDAHDQLAKQMVERYRGTIIKSTGDGMLATFDGPGRAVLCAIALGIAAGQMDISLRAGLHTGEIELRGADIGGIAVHAAARIMAQSQRGEVLVSRVVTDLVSGADLRFVERGSHELKGLPGRWDLFAASL
jgi:pimeloyl-ACP methyl ester carboxylesterase